MHNPSPLRARVKQNIRLDLKGVKEMRNKKCGFTKSKKMVIASYVFRLILVIIDILLKLDSIIRIAKRLGKG
jgi:hypothetical protein